MSEAYIECLRALPEARDGYSDTLSDNPVLRGIKKLQAEVKRLTDEPIEMVLCCPECGEQHIDRVKPDQDWSNPPHKTHQCDFCDHCWRPCDRPTEGVAKTKTLGKIADEDGAIFKTYKYQFDAIKRLTDENDAMREQLKEPANDVDLAAWEAAKRLRALTNERDALREQLTPQPIETAPKDTEVLVWREDMGWLLGRFGAQIDYLSEDELSRGDGTEIYDEDWLNTNTWMLADFMQGEALQLDEWPTLWLPKPKDKGGDV